IQPHGTTKGRIQLADAGVVERTTRRLDCQSARPGGAGVRRTGGRGKPAQDGQPPDIVEDMGLGIGRPGVAVSEYEMDAGKILTMRRLILTGVDAILGWKSRLSGAVRTGRGSTIAWRRIRRVAGNTLSIGEDS